MYPEINQRQDAERRYNELRKEALKAAEGQLQDRSLTFTQITQEAVIQTEAWDESALRPYPWNWREGRSRYFSRYPKRFEAALWKENTLIAISLGRPTFGAGSIRLDIIEGAPRDLIDRPNVTRDILFAYEIYAGLLGADYIRIMNPLTEELKAYYTSLGYSYMRDGDYLVRRLLS